MNNMTLEIPMSSVTGGNSQCLEGSHRRPMYRHRVHQLPPMTDLGFLRGSNAACVVDEDNMNINLLENFMQTLSYRALSRRIGALAASAEFWTVGIADVTSGRGINSDIPAGKEWNTLLREEVIVQTPWGVRRNANADDEIVMKVIELVKTGRFNAILLATGDGDLAVRIGQWIRRNHYPVRIFTLAVPGSRSRRHETRRDLFDCTAYVGNDIVEPIVWQ
jgi:hypothetical protein